MTVAQRYLLAVLIGLCVALVLDMPSVEALVAANTGWPYLARLSANVSAMAAALCANAMVLAATADNRRINGLRQIRWCLTASVVVGAYMTAVLLGTDARLDSDFA